MTSHEETVRKGVEKIITEYIDPPAEGTLVPRPFAEQMFPFLKEANDGSAEA